MHSCIQHLRAKAKCDTGSSYMPMWSIKKAVLECPLEQKAAACSLGDVDEVFLDDIRGQRTSKVIFTYIRSEKERGHLQHLRKKLEE